MAGVLGAIVYSVVPEANRPRLVAQTPPVTLDDTGGLSLSSSALCDEVHYVLTGHPDTATRAFRATGCEGALRSVFKQGAIVRALITVDCFLTGGKSASIAQRLDSSKRRRWETCSPAPVPELPIWPASQARKRRSTTFLRDCGFPAPR